jgi:hypothetical protein
VKDLQPPDMKGPWEGHEASCQARPARGRLKRTPAPLSPPGPSATQVEWPRPLRSGQPPPGEGGGEPHPDEAAHSAKDYDTCR